MLPILPPASPVSSLPLGCTVDGDASLRHSAHCQSCCWSRDCCHENPTFCRGRAFSHSVRVGKIGLSDHVDIELSSKSTEVTHNSKLAMNIRSINEFGVCTISDSNYGDRLLPWQQRVVLVFSHTPSPWQQQVVLLFSYTSSPWQKCITKVLNSCN